MTLTITELLDTSILSASHNLNPIPTHPKEVLNRNVLGTVGSVFKESEIIFPLVVQHGDVICSLNPGAAAVNAAAVTFATRTKPLAASGGCGSHAGGCGRARTALGWGIGWRSGGWSAKLDDRAREMRNSYSCAL